MGDQVLAYDEATGPTGPYTATWQHRDPFITTLTINDEEIETTPEHPFFVLLRGWVLAGDLRVGDSVRLRDGSYGVVETAETHYDPQVMYNITVAEAHTYFVGDDGCTVHNCSDRTVFLYRAVDVLELDDVLRFGDYGYSPNFSGKYFALTEQGVRDLAYTGYNKERQLTITRIEVPETFLDRGYQFYDAGYGGAKKSIHFDDDTLTDLYKVMKRPEIIDAPWVPILGGC